MTKDLKESFGIWALTILVVACLGVGTLIGERYGVAHGWPKFTGKYGVRRTLGGGIGGCVGMGVGLAVVMLFNIEKLRKTFATEGEVDEKNKEAGLIAVDEKNREAGPVAEETAVQAKCKNCAKMLNCDTFEDDWRCCEKHEFFRGKQSQQRKGV